MDQSKFRDIETIYNELKERFKNEEISYEDMKNELQKLVLRDENNKYWMLGANTGKWYILDNSEWVERSPYEREIVEEEKKIEVSIEKENFKNQTKKKSYQPITLFISAVVILGVIILIFFLSRSKSPDTVQKSSQEDSIIKKSDTQISPPTGKEEIKEEKIWNLSNEIFQGSSPMRVKESGPIFTEEKDPEIVAIGNALKIRVEILKGSRTSKTSGLINQITEGNFQGFNIKATLTKRQDKVIKDEIIIITPTKGTIKIEKNILSSIKNTDYTKFHQELINNGIEIVAHPNPEHNTMNIQLNVIKFMEKPVENEFLISHSEVGKIKLNMQIEMIESVLPSNYSIFKRDIWHNNKNYNVYKIFDENRSPMFFIYSQNKKVWGIQVVSNKFKTERGIGIDNTLGDFLIHYSKIKIGTTATDAPYAFMDNINALFFLQSGEIDLENNMFPNQTKITWILLGNSPYLE